MFGKIKKCVSFLAGTTSALVAMLGFGGCSESTTAIHKVDVPEECLDKVGLELSTCVEDYIRNGVDANNGSDEPSYAYYGPAPSFDPTLACNDGEGRCSPYQNYYVCENGQWAYAEKCEYGCEDNFGCIDMGNTVYGPPPVVCEDGEQKCEKLSLYSCVTGAWTFVRDCMIECSPDWGCMDNAPVYGVACVPACTDDGNKIVCESDMASREVQCELGCRDAACIEDLIPTRDCEVEGEKNCFGNSLLVCRNGNTVLDAYCDNGCSNNACIPKDD
ncbi:MAG: hypothetical protein IIY06_06730 [Proteobacteria bacterium]|nr:hypothetical protein [Pseudomonadota bacterium]